MLALYIMAGIVLLILLGLSIPVDMAFDVGGPGAARSRMRLGWLFGLLGKEFGRRKKEPKERAPKRKKKRWSAKPFLSVSIFRGNLLMTKGVVRGLLKLSRRNPQRREGEASGRPSTNRAGRPRRYSNALLRIVAGTRPPHL